MTCSHQTLYTPCRLLYNLREGVYVDGDGDVFEGEGVFMPTLKLSQDKVRGPGSTPNCCQATFIWSAFFKTSFTQIMITFAEASLIVCFYF